MTFPFTAKLTPIFRNYDIKYAGVFGSYARGEEREDSDVDILVRLGKPLALPNFIRLENEIASLLNKKVDLVTVDGLKDRLKDRVMSEVKTIYGE